MENKKVVPTWVSIILLVLCAINLVGAGIMVVTSNSIKQAISSSLSFCAVILALIYCFMGYKKNAAKFFRFFSIALIMLVLLQINHYATSSRSDRPRSAPMEQYNVETSIDANVPAQEPQDAGNDVTSFEDSKSILITTPTVLFGMLFTLTVAKDLGKKKSYWLAGLSFALSLFSFVLALIRVSKLFNDFSFSIGVISAGVSVEFSIFILCAIYGIMVYAKYQDKTARGTK